MTLQSPKLHPLGYNFLQHCFNSGPAARCIALSIPPPPNKEGLAALTMILQSNLVMSPFQK